jgi:hypothetical protein
MADPPLLTSHEIIQLADEAANAMPKRRKVQRYDPLKMAEAKRLSKSWRLWQRLSHDNQATTSALGVRLRLDEISVRWLRTRDEYANLVRGLPDPLLDLPGATWRDDVAHLDQVSAETLGLPPDFKSQTGRLRPTFRWQWLAAPLAADIARAMRASNPNYGSGLGNITTPGPTIRILTAIIPRISGEHPKPRTIASWLSKQSMAWKRAKEKSAAAKQ